ncbi:hypothetical protein CJO79_06260 [Ralstonia solanacearum]|nr:hypothetical protein CJO79_06260 [Ralstonia solanacearum]
MGQPGARRRHAREKLEALKLLAGDTNPQTRQRILPLLAKDSAPTTHCAPPRRPRWMPVGAAAQGRAGRQPVRRPEPGLGAAAGRAGLAITYGLIGVINMAHGEFLMIGAYATYVVQTIFRNHFPARSTGICRRRCRGVPGGGGGRFALERSVLRHLYGRPLETLLAPSRQPAADAGRAQPVRRAERGGGQPELDERGIALYPGLILPYNRLVILAFALVVVAMAWAVLNRTRLGLFVRATTQNRAMAACVGVRT